MKKIIKLNSRYGGNYIELLDKNPINDEELDYVLKVSIPYIRVIYRPESVRTIEAVDPDGGPFMAIGDSNIVKGYSINKIRDTKEGLIITFRKND